MARPGPMKRASRAESPQPESRPTRACVSAKRASGVAINRSQESAISKPPVTASPLIAPMTGWWSVRSSFGGSAIALRLRFGSLISTRSRPAQKARPAPVRMTTPISSSWRRSSIVRARRSRSSSERAFSTPGRFNVRVAMPSDFSTSRTGSDMARTLPCLVVWAKASYGSPAMPRLLLRAFWPNRSSPGELAASSLRCCAGSHGCRLRRRLLERGNLLRI